MKRFNFSSTSGPLRGAATTAILAVVVGCFAVPALAGPKGTIHVRPLGDRKLTIDGDISDWPLAQFKKVAEQPLFPAGQDAVSTTAEGDHLVFEKQRIGLFNGTTDEAFEANDSDFGVTTYFAYDQTNLYILAVFIDDVLRDDNDTTEFGSTGYLNDGFEFFLDAKGDSTDCISDDAFPSIDQAEPNIDDFQVTVAINSTFKPTGSPDNVLGARQTVERAGNLDFIGADKGGPGGIYRDQLDAGPGPDIAARKYDDLRAAGALNPEIAAKPNVKFTGYAIEMRVPLGGKIPDVVANHPMGFEIFWRDVDGEADPGAGGNISWASWAQSTAVPCDDPKTSLFHTANWGQIVFDDTDPLGPSTPPPGDLKGLLGYWRMDETNGTAVSDSTGKGNNGNITNNAAGSWVTDSERGQVYRATGTNVIDFGIIIPAMTTSNDFTWSLWLKSDETGTAAAADNNIVFGNRYNAAGVDFNPREFIKFTPSNFEWHFNGAGQNVSYDDFVTNKWTHHLVVKQGTNLTYYRDGAPSTNGTITGGPKNPQPLYLGGQGTQERWKGLADEVAIFDRALSAAEAQQAYDLGKAGESLAPPVSQIPLPAAANLKLWLSADKGVTATAGSVSAWEDQSGNLNNAAQADAGLQPQLVDNAVNNKPVLRFDGTNDYLIVPNSPSVAIAGDITTFFVVKFDDFATFRAVWAKTAVNFPGANDWYALPNTGIPRAYRGNGSATSIGSVDGTTALKAGEYLIAGFDMAGTTLHHYLNGESTGEGQITATLVDAGKPLLIGTRDDLFTKMKGDIAEIIIYDTALSDADRSQVVDYLVSKYGIGTSGGVGPAELGQTLNGFQDDFTGATRDPDWQAFGPGGDHYEQADGLLYVSPSAGDPNHLLYMKAGYSNDVQEVLARIRATAFGPQHDYPRGGLAVGVQANPTNLTANPGYNLHFRDSTQDNVPGRQFKLLDDARAWGPPGLRTNIPPQTTPGWTNNVWYWLRLRVAPKEDGTNNLYGKVWAADGATVEPTDWQLRWSDSALPKPLRTGFAGIAGSSVDGSNNGLGHFEVDYVLIKAAGLPQIKVDFQPTGPAPTVPEFTGITKLAGNKIQLEWIGAGTLEQADTVTGPWAAVPASSALGIITITPSVAGKFYRLHQQ